MRHTRAHAIARVGVALRSARLRPAPRDRGRLEELHRVNRDRRDLRAGARARRFACHTPLGSGIDADRDGSDEARRDRYLSRIYGHGTHRRVTSRPDCGPASQLRLRARRLRSRLRHRVARSVADERFARACNDNGCRAALSLTHALRPRAAGFAPSPRDDSRIRRRAPTGFPVCNASTAASVSHRFARTTSRSNIEALLDGDADIATAFTTDGAIAVDRLVVLADDKHLWPTYNVAPLVRAATLAREPRITSALNAIAPKLTDEAARSMNAQVESHDRDPADVAAEFLRGVA